MAIPTDGLKRYISSTQRQVMPVKKRTPGTKLIEQHRNVIGKAVKPVGWNGQGNAVPNGINSVNKPTIPKPQRDASSDIKAPVIEAQQSVGNTEEDIHQLKDQTPQETQTPEQDINAEMGQSANQFEELLAAKRQKEAAAAAAAAGGTTAGGVAGEFSGGVLDGLDAEQSQYAQMIIQQGKSRGMNDSDIQTAIMTALAESGLRNVNYGDRDSVGLFQQRTSQGWGSVQQIMDPTYSIGKFYDALAGTNRNGMSQWQAAQAVQRSAFADGSNYRDQYDKAMRIYNSYSSGAATAPVMGSNGSASWINANNGRYHDYDGAYGAQCVDLYNFYATGFVGANPNQARVVGAKDIWNNYDTRAMTKIAAQSRPQQGDIVVWDGSWGGGYGHVGIVAGVNPNGTLKVLNANATSAGSRGNTVISNYGMGGVLGFLRPNKLMGR